jgi:AcrR family transcriptional regulator
VGLERILGEVGITKTAFYKHFESKDDLILAVLDHRDRQDIVDAIAHMRRCGGSDPRAQILAFFDLLVTWFARPDFRGCFFMNAATEFASPNDPIHRAATEHGQHIASELLLRAQAAGLPDPERLTKQLMILISGAISSRHTGNVVDAAVTASLTAKALLYGPAHESADVSTSAPAAAAPKRRKARPRVAAAVSTRGSRSKRSGRVSSAAHRA